MRKFGSALALLTFTIFWFGVLMYHTDQPIASQNINSSAFANDSDSTTLDNTNPILPVAWTEQAENQGNSETNKLSSFLLLTNYGHSFLNFALTASTQSKPQLGYFNLNKQFSVLPNAP